MKTINRLRKLASLLTFMIELHEQDHFDPDTIACVTTIDDKKIHCKSYLSNAKTKARATQTIMYILAT